jgi:hypothetical protein
VSHVPTAPLAALLPRNLPSSFQIAVSSRSEGNRVSRCETLLETPSTVDRVFEARRIPAATATHPTRSGRTCSTRRSREGSAEDHPIFVPRVGFRALQTCGTRPMGSCVERAPVVDRNISVSPSRLARPRRFLHRDADIPDRGPTKPNVASMLSALAMRSPLASIHDQASISPSPSLARTMARPSTVVT